MDDAKLDRPGLSRMDAEMLSNATRRLALLIVVVAGCDTPSKRQPSALTQPVVSRGTQAAPKPLTFPDKPISPARQVDDLDDRSLLIPPPPPNRDEMAKPAVVESPREPGIELAKATEVAPNSVTNNLPIAPWNSSPAASGIEKDEGIAAAKRIHQNAVASYARLDAFEARLTRRETINGKAGPTEIISYKFRKEPFSVRLKWLGPEGHGREVIYVLGQHGGKMHIMPTRQDAFPLPPMRMAFFPDDSMVRSKARHDIREAGFSESIRQIGNLLTIIAKNPSERSRLRYLGLVTRPEFAAKMEAIEETIAPKTEPLFPQGGKRVTFFDTGAQSASQGLPVIVVAYDAATRKEVEYYCFDNFMHPIRIGDADFDPEIVFSKNSSR